MDPKITESDPPSYRNGITKVLQYGEFTATGNRKVRYAVSLTERDLTIQKITSTPAGRSKVVFNLRDCVGCRAFSADDNADAGAYFSVYFYPFKRRWMSSGVARQRVEQCFRVALFQDPRTNLEEAEKWAGTIRENSVRQQHLRNHVLYSEVHRPCSVMLLVNPHSGKGQALSLFTGHVQRMLNEAGVPHTLVITERQNHARELVREADLSQWGALVIMSGDGLLFEVVNGLMEREDWEEAIQTPLGILPGGSGNALAASIHHYSGAQPVSSEELLVSCGFLLCKGLVSRMDLASVHLGSSPSNPTRLFSFLSLAWGFVADVDVESEKYRHVGAARFTMGTLVRLASLRVYKGRLAYLPVDEVDGEEEDGQSPVSLEMTSMSPQHQPPSSAFCSSTLLCQPLKDSPCQNAAHHTFHNSRNSNNAFKAKKREPMSANATLTGPPDSLLVPLDQPVPSDWVIVPEEDFVLMLAMYQSHLAKDLYAAPDSTLDDGLIHLIYVRAGISRTALLRLFLAMEKGTHLANNCPHLVYTRVRALRLEPYSSKGVITVDGEVVEYGPVQAQVHGGIARLITRL
ncbi:sphingosine kinase 1-like [Salvelinus fontinalis]|uniref:sphingosine kinase 1-like n=1 Tax=Salvelinus fontinalis TaxID=8038 RepID=UPI0024855200|nr:sphingosine kinase 1-like [Salvelinus fontinalis]